MFEVQGLKTKGMPEGISTLFSRTRPDKRKAAFWNVSILK